MKSLTKHLSDSLVVIIAQHSRSPLANFLIYIFEKILWEELVHDFDNGIDLLPSSFEIVLHVFFLGSWYQTALIAWYKFPKLLFLFLVCAIYYVCWYIANFIYNLLCKSWKVFLRTSTSALDVQLGRDVVFLYFLLNRCLSCATRYSSWICRISNVNRNFGYWSFIWLSCSRLLSCLLTLRDHLLFLLILFLIWIFTFLTIA